MMIYASKEVGRMPHPRFSGEEVERRGQELYEREIRSKVENENEGKIIAIDIETGDYEIADDNLAAARRLLDRHPGAAIWALRIGYNAVQSLGGSLRPTK